MFVNQAFSAACGLCSSPRTSRLTASSFCRPRSTKPAQTHRTPTGASVRPSPASGPDYDAVRPVNRFGRPGWTSFRPGAFMVKRAVKQHRAARHHGSKGDPVGRLRIAARFLLPLVLLALASCTSDRGSSEPPPSPPSPRPTRTSTTSGSGPTTSTCLAAMKSRDRPAQARQLRRSPSGRRAIKSAGSSPGSKVCQRRRTPTFIGARTARSGRSSSPWALPTRPPAAPTASRPRCSPRSRPTPAASTSASKPDCTRPGPPAGNSDHPAPEAGVYSQE